MAYLMLEASVRTHPKFLSAGPEASWLWVCGLGYCQEGLTDGFIPDGAIEYLGVKRPRTLAKKLVAARLWEHVSGGWQMHDYLAHNKSAEEVREIMRKRKAGGKKGGRPSKPSDPQDENLEGSIDGAGEVNLPRNPILPTDLPTYLPVLPQEDQDQNKPPQNPRRDPVPVENPVEKSEGASPS